MGDIFSLVKQLSLRDIKCGSFDMENPSPLRLLSFLGKTKEYLMRDEDLKTLPFDFQNLTTDIAIELAVLNTTKVAEKRKLDHSDCDIPSTIDLLGDAEDDEVVLVKYDKVNLPLRFEFNNGRRIIDQAKNQQIVLTASSAKFSTLVFLT